MKGKKNIDLFALQMIHLDANFCILSNTDYFRNHKPPFFLLSYQFSHLHPFGIIVFTIFLGLILSSTKNKVRVSTKSTRHPFQREQRT